MNELIEAYFHTEYRVPAMNLVLKIGQNNRDLDHLLVAHHVTTWAFITAWNPCSEILSEADNKIRNESLLKEIQNYPHYEGIGVGTDPFWTPEESYLILGLYRDAAYSLGHKYAQNAVVWGEVGGLGELVIIDDKN